eukprot:GHRQ01033726.1.p2 GENE.GHRQ01033726.1~~GHRQ01033726.1.p2  ORF type:complete len:101 (-),score=14.47 GHRQ01033726.1:199-501(-)
MASFVAVLRCTSCGGLPHSAAEHLTLLWLQQELTPSPHWQLLVVTCNDDLVPTGTLGNRVARAAAVAHRRRGAAGMSGMAGSRSQAPPSTTSAVVFAATT